MGLGARRRSFADQNVFMACNTQAQIPGARYQACTKRKGSATEKVCYDIRKKMSYAIPLEIVYLTPLLSWNPYNLEFKEGLQPERTVSQGGRNGGVTADKAYNGTAKRAFFRTPKEFFLDQTDRNPADTGKDVVGVLDRNGEVKEVRASGTRIFLPSIPGVGEIRLRWPIHPVSKEGSPIQKELDALKNIVLRMSSYSDMLLEVPPGTGDGSITRPPVTDDDIDLHVDQTSNDPPGLHNHKFTLTTEDVATLFGGGEVTVETTEDLSHSHTLLLRISNNGEYLRIARCDGRGMCWDGHRGIISEAAPLIKQYRNNLLHEE